MNKKIKALVVALSIIASLSSSVIVYAGVNTSNVIVNNNSEEETAKSYVDQALKEKTFYKYNVAYEAILKVDNKVKQDSLMNSLATIANIVWSEDVKKFNKMLDELVATNGSGRIYDEIEATVGKSSLQEVDKAYLLGELTSWGKRLVYTPDYAVAVEKVVKAWNALNAKDSNILSIIADADIAISAVKNTYSKDYLKEQIQQVKEKNNQATESFIFDKEYTDKLNKTSVTNYINNTDVNKADALIQSAINLSQGKEVLEDIKLPWYPYINNEILKDVVAQYIDYTELIAIMDIPQQDSQYYGKLNPKRNSYYFRYTVVYKNVNNGSYRLHYITLGI